MDRLQGIVEVVTTGRRGANEYLANGYELLSIDVETKFQIPLEAADNPNRGFVKRFVVFVLGRRSDTPKHVIERTDPTAPPVV